MLTCCQFSLTERNLVGLTPSPDHPPSPSNHPPSNTYHQSRPPNSPGPAHFPPRTSDPLDRSPEPHTFILVSRRRSEILERDLLPAFPRGATPPPIPVLIRGLPLPQRASPDNIRPIMDHSLGSPIALHASSWGPDTNNPS